MPSNRRARAFGLSLFVRPWTLTNHVGNNSVFRSFFEKQKLTGPNFIDWYRQLRLVLSTEDKENYLEHPIPVAPPGQQVPHQAITTHAAWVKGQKEVVVLMLLTMDLEIQRNLAHLGAYDMLQELKAMHSKQAEQELLQTNYNIHGMGKTVNELHAMLNVHEESLPKKDVNLVLHAIRAGRVQKNQKNKPHKAAKGGHGKGKGKMGNASFAYKPKTPPPPKKDNPAKDAVCHQYGEIGHWRRNCPVKSWIYDTGCGTHIGITTQGLRGSKKLKPGALGYTSRFLTHSDEALEIKKFKRERDNKIEFAYDYGSLNASYVNKKIIFSNDYFQEIINPDFKKIDSSFKQTSLLKPYVLALILEKIIIDLENEVVSLLDKEKENLKIIESLKSKGFESGKNAISESENQSENDCQEVEKECDNLENSNVIALEMFKLDMLSSVRRPNPSGVMWKKMGSSNTLKLICLIDNRSAHVCNNARNAYCNSYDVDVNDLFVFDDVSLRKSHVSKMPFKKKHSASLNVPSKSKLNKYLPRIVGKWLPKLQPLAEPVAKWIPRVTRQIDKIAKTPNSPGPIFKWLPKRMTGNRALLKNFVEKFRGTVRFGNNDFKVIDGYGDVVIRSMTIKKFYYVEGLVQRVRTDNGTEFKNKTLSKFFDEVGITQQIFAARTTQQNGVVERKNQNLVEAARTMLTFANRPLFLWAESIATACFTQNRSIINKCFDKTPFELMNKRKPNIKFFHVFGCKCYLLNNYDDVRKLKKKRDIGVFVGYSKESASVTIYNKQTRKIQESVNIMKSSTRNVETSNIEIPSREEEVFHESSESFQEESYSSSLNDDV
nr:zinc finger, CCHC-type [Tanacetum cinerariifolium]